MPISSIKTVIIHDNLSPRDPLIVELQKIYGKNNVIFFKDAQEGLTYLNEHITEKLIVLLDLNFESSNPLTGGKLFEEIRKKTSLIYVIIWTAADLSSVDKEDLVSFINNDALAFAYATADTAEIINLINKASHQLSTRIDALLEDLIAHQPNNTKDTPTFMTKDGKQYTLNEIADSIRHQDELGKMIEASILNLAIDLLIRHEKPI